MRSWITFCHACFGTPRADDKAVHVPQCCRIIGQQSGNTCHSPLQLRKACVTYVANVEMWVSTWFKLHGFRFNCTQTEYRFFPQIFWHFKMNCIFSSSPVGRFKCWKLTLLQTTDNIHICTCHRRRNIDICTKHVISCISGGGDGKKALKPAMVNWDCFKIWKCHTTG